MSFLPEIHYSKKSLSEKLVFIRLSCYTTSIAAELAGEAREGLKRRKTIAYAGIKAWAELAGEAREGLKRCQHPLNGWNFCRRTGWRSP